MSALKTRARASSDDPYRVGGLVIPFGGRDHDGEHFDASTDLGFDLFPSEGRPILYHHGLDEDAGVAVIGRQVGKTIDEAGVWIQAQLDRHSRWVERVLKLDPSVITTVISW